MGVNRIGDVDNRASEGQAARVYGTGFKAGYLVRIRAQEMSGLRPKVGSDKELMEVGRMGERD
jgi:hypothetical protein